jgi:hypothetical protein
MSTPYDHPTPYDGTAPYDTGVSSAERPSIGDMLGEISSDITTLMRQELELAKAELQQSAKRAGKGAGMFAGAGIAGHMTLLFLSIAAWWGIGDETGHGWSAVIVAIVWAVIAAVLAVTGRTEIKTVTGVPQTAATVKKIPAAAAGHEETR